MSETTKTEVETDLKICPACKEEVERLFYNYKENPLCKTCLTSILKESNKTINAIRNFVSA